MARTEIRSAQFKDGSLVDADVSDAAAIKLTKSAAVVTGLTDQATITTDAAAGTIFTVTLAGNRTLANPTNSVDGMKRIWRFKQDATGSRTISLGTDFRLGTDITAITLTTTAAKTDYMGAIYNGTDAKWDVVAFIKGF